MKIVSFEDFKARKKAVNYLWPSDPTLKHLLELFQSDSSLPTQWIITDTLTKMEPDMTVDVFRELIVFAPCPDAFFPAYALEEKFWRTHLAFKPEDLFFFSHLWTRRLCLFSGCEAHSEKNLICAEIVGTTSDFGSFMNDVYFLSSIDHGTTVAALENIEEVTEASDPTLYESLRSHYEGSGS